MSGNSSHLLERFFQRLVELEPGSVLDVGTGTGRLLKLCRDAGIAAEGVDQDAGLATDLQGQGVPARQADASALPFADAAFDWVALRHVLHHVDEVAGALDEACRVARVGVLVAEPWFDTSLPSQALALRVDRWLKGQDRRRGRSHNENLDANQILALLPVDQDFEADFQCYLRLRDRPVAEFEDEAAPLLADLAADDPQRQAYDELLAEVRQHGLTWNGTMILCLRRR